ncbi:hypothetical protein SPRG_04921 [Saprolegnia parasitica CBS 223.65]|uniref:Uncharacterized protein n=1 Tax=Saprolegnia parasitica (strain CBS 223.65) TaxID=695850 RepID=A0A067CTF2_SAPPC|nr:hypothetical protein SPRG_04921 [Saprolegnia parasitica CBS 223.65]KDO29806.1 hypothetical protein SPRG_04921 [Saprolegnia parasitica CBS 223.65]|eukprot:XP_012199449.1 hypothetical protein SPRG_04921 [Saprolegnia parasitica CBS 223.65]
MERERIAATANNIQAARNAAIARAQLAEAARLAAQTEAHAAATRAHQLAELIRQMQEQTHDDASMENRSVRNKPPGNPSGIPRQEPPRDPPGYTPYVPPTPTRSTSSSDWNLKCKDFSGQETYPGLGSDFPSWLRSFEDAIAHNKACLPDHAWNDEQRRGALIQKLSGEALECYNHYRDELEGRTFGYHDLVTRLRRTFQSLLSPNQAAELLKAPKPVSKSWLAHLRFYRHVQRQFALPVPMVIRYFVHHACPERAETMKLILGFDNEWNDFRKLDSVITYLTQEVGTGVGYKTPKHAHAHFTTPTPRNRGTRRDGDDDSSGDDKSSDTSIPPSRFQKKWCERCRRNTHNTTDCYGAKRLRKKDAKANSATDATPEPQPTSIAKSIEEALARQLARDDEWIRKQQAAIAEDRRRHDEQMRKQRMFDAQQHHEWMRKQQAAIAEDQRRYDERTREDQRRRDEQDEQMRKQLADEQRRNEEARRFHEQIARTNTKSPLKSDEPKSPQSMLTHKLSTNTRSRKRTTTLKARATIKKQPPSPKPQTLSANAQK